MFEFAKNTRPVFKDEALQQQLENDGYVIVPFYTKEDVEKLTAVYNDITDSGQAGFRPTTYFQDKEYRLAASKAIRETAAPHLDEYLVNYKAFMGSFIVKHPGQDSELRLHQDMTLVDESKFMGINVWMPLCDTNEMNGALHIIPKSHRIFPTYRCATIPNIYDRHKELIVRYMEPLYMNAGQAIFFDNSLLHYSPANSNDIRRIATNVFVTHQEAAITICYNDKASGQIELFEQEDTFFTEYEQFDNDQNQLRPMIGRSIGMTDYDFPVLSPEDIRQRYGNPPVRNWKERIRSVFQ